MKLQCNTCGGTYNDGTPNGVGYFHACAPLSEAEAKTPALLARIQAGETIERPNKRDEAPVADATGKVTGIKSAGTGVTAI